jgi:hypothetical protein
VDAVDVPRDAVAPESSSSMRSRADRRRRQIAEALLRFAERAQRTGTRGRGLLRHQAPAPSRDVAPRDALPPKRSRGAVCAVARHSEAHSAQRSTFAPTRTEDALAGDHGDQVHRRHAARRDNVLLRLDSPRGQRAERPAARRRRCLAHARTRTGPRPAPGTRPRIAAPKPGRVGPAAHPRSPLDTFQDFSRPRLLALR